MRAQKNDTLQVGCHGVLKVFCNSLQVRSHAVWLSAFATVSWPASCTSLVHSVFFVKWCRFPGGWRALS